MPSTQYASTLHVLILLAAEQDSLHTSTSLAARMDTNPVVLRRIIADLSKAGLVITRRGAGGGVSLANNPEDITLGQVANVIKAEMTFDVHQVPDQTEADLLSHAALTAIEAQRRALHTASIVELDRTTLRDVTQAATLRSDLAKLLAEGLSDDEIRNGYRIDRGRLVPMEE